MTDLIKQITGDLQRQIQSFEPQLGITDIGVVVEAGDGIARVRGLANVKAQELVQFCERRDRHGVQPGEGQRRRNHPGRLCRNHGRHDRPWHGTDCLRTCRRRT